MKHFIRMVLIGQLLFLPAQFSIAYAASSSNIDRYTVLVLDISSEEGFYYNGTCFYTSGASIENVKASARSFVEHASYASGNNYIAIVTYYSDKAEVVCPFTDSYSLLISEIEKLEAHEDSKSIAEGLSQAETLIDGITDHNGIKNVVLFTTGDTDAGPYNYSGKYDSSAPGNGWFENYNGEQVKLYAFANEAYDSAEILKTKATIYVIGLFQGYDDMPSGGGQEIVEFFKLFSLDLASSSNCFFDVSDPSDLRFTFGEVAGIATTSGGVSPRNNPDYSFDKLLAECSSSEYNPRLAHLLADICHETGSEDKLQAAFSDMGFMDWETDYSFTHEIFISYGIGTKKLSDGTDLVLLSVRGTAELSDNPMEWLGNLFDSKANEYGEHSSFSDAGRDLWSAVVQFLDAPDMNIGPFDYDNAKFVITGHSRGAAAANILAAYMDSFLNPDNVYCYTIACPDTAVITAERAASYRNIFNIGNINDPVTWVPSRIWQDSGENYGWGADSYWNKYGRSYWLPATSWDDYDNISDEIFGDRNLLNRAVSYHDHSIYLEYLRAEPEPTDFKNRDECIQLFNIATQTRQPNSKIVVVNIFCPVDVRISDMARHELISIIDNESQRQAYDSNYLVTVDGDRKRIILSDPSSVHIDLTATGSGEMEFSICEGNDYLSALSNGKTFEHISLENGKTMSATYDSFKPVKDVKLFETDQDGKQLAEILQSGKEVKPGNRLIKTVLIIVIVCAILIVATLVALTNRQHRRRYRKK